MTLLGNRIELRRYLKSDGVHIYKWQRNKATTKWMGRRYRTPKSLEKITANVVDIIKKPPKNALYYAIADKVTDRYLGGIDITSIDSLPVVPGYGMTVVPN